MSPPRSRTQRENRVRTVARFVRAKTTKMCAPSLADRPLAGPRSTGTGVPNELGFASAPFLIVTGADTNDFTFSAASYARTTKRWSPSGTRRVSTETSTSLTFEHGAARHHAHLSPLRS